MTLGQLDFKYFITRQRWTITCLALGPTVV